MADIMLNGSNFIDGVADSVQNGMNNNGGPFGFSSSSGSAPPGFEAQRDVVLGQEVIAVLETQDLDGGGGDEEVEMDSFDEDTETWKLRKVLGLFVDDEDKVIAFLAAKHKQHKGKCKAKSRKKNHRRTKA